MAKPKQPNIIFVIADDTTPAYHGCYGGPTPTPNIDSIARDGALFRQSRCVAPLCNPSRYSIFTGQFVGRAGSIAGEGKQDEPHYVLQNAELGPETPTVAKMLKSVGYHTCHVGKWHSGWQTSFGPGEHDGRIGPDEDLHDPDTQRRQQAIYDARLETVRTFAGIDEAHALSWGNIGAANGPPPIKVHNVQWQTDAALSFLDRTGAGSTPFYLHIAETVPHGPDPSAELGKDHRYTAGGILDHEPAGHPPDETVHERLRQSGFASGGRLYGINAGMVMLDDQIGAILGKLRELGIEQNTLVVYAADHGIAGKGSCYYPGTHLPLVMRWPGRIAAGTVIEEPVMHVDFLPTLLAAAGGTPTAPTDGINLLPALTGAGSISRDATFAEMGWTRSVTRGRFSYIAFRYPESVIAEMARGETDVAIDHVARYAGSFGDMNARSRPHYFDPDQLYDIKADPYCRTNLAADPTHAQTLRELQATLAEHLASFTRPFPLEVPEFVRSEKYIELVAERQARMDPPFLQPPEVEEVYGENLKDAEEGHHGG